MASTFEYIMIVWVFIAIGIIIWALRFNRKMWVERTEGFKKYAQEKGYRFIDTKNAEIKDALNFLKVFLCAVEGTKNGVPFTFVFSKERELGQERSGNSASGIFPGENACLICKTDFDFDYLEMRRNSLDTKKPLKERVLLRGRPEERLSTIDSKILEMVYSKNVWVKYRNGYFYMYFIVNTATVHSTITHVDSYIRYLTYFVNLLLKRDTIDIDGDEGFRKMEKDMRQNPRKYFDV
jgi:hypothetical protein